LSASAGSDWGSVLALGMSPARADGSENPPTQATNNRVNRIRVDKLTDPR